MRPSVAIAIALLAPAPVAAQDTSSDIVVTGRPLSQTERALAACLERRCSPPEDIAATLAHAENQFIAGDYSAARRTLLAGRGRNKRFGAQYPVPVGDLLRANGRLASLNGRTNEAKIGQIESVDALKSGLPTGDPRILMQRLEVGSAQVARGQVQMGANVYRTVAAQAHAAGLPMVEGIALLRRAVLYSAFASFFPAYRPTAKAAVSTILRTTDPALAPFREGALLLQAQVAAKEGDDATVDAAIARFRGMPTVRPALLYAPAADLHQPAQTSITSTRLRGSDKAQWADISYWVTAEGKVRDLTVLRQSDPSADWWLKPVTAAVAKRRYAPLKVPPGSAGALRIERFSMVFDFVAVTGGRIPSRNAIGRLESIDLTVDPPTR